MNLKLIDIFQKETFKIMDIIVNNNNCWALQKMDDAS